MKRIIILMLVIYSSYCTMDECDRETDKNKCNSIEVEYDDFFCFKVDFVGANSNSSCISYPKEANYQKAYWNLYDGLMKELFSSEGNELKNSTESADKVYDLLSKILSKSEKESYNTDEQVKIIKNNLTSTDKEIISSGETCFSYLVGGYKENSSNVYENIPDKNTCFNAQQFDDLKNLVDCGYAIINFSIDGEDHQIKTCYLIPNNNMPKNFSTLYMNYLKESIDGDLGLLKTLFYYIAGKSLNEKEVTEERLSNMTYNIEVENKDGKKVKYSSDKNDYEVIAEGTKPQKTESGDSTTEGNENSEGKGLYININLILLILFYSIYFC